MIQYKNECVGCRDIGLPCQGSSCPNRNVRYLYCDKCKKEVNELFDVYGEELCDDCMKSKFETGRNCENCGHEADELYEVEGNKICEWCLIEHFPTVARNEF